jgi:uncharacterized membrane protein
MWFSSLLSSSAAAFGRLFVVNLLPTAITVLWVYALVRAGSFTGQSDWSRLIPRTIGTDLLPILLVVLAIVVVAVLLQPFQIRIVRILEGYWNSWRVTAALAPVFVEYQWRKTEDLRDRINTLTKRLDETDLPADLSGQSRLLRSRPRWEAQRQRANTKLERYPATRPRDAKQIQLLPTALGNALRTAETSAGERYGLDTIKSWPRMYSLFSDKFAALQLAARNSLDAAANLCVNFFLVTVLAVVALIDEPKAYWVPVLAAVMCCVSYLGSIAAAVEYTTFVRAAYDLHRFDLLKAMHHKLPRTPEDEVNLFETLSRFFAAEDNEDPTRLVLRYFDQREYAVDDGSNSGHANDAAEAHDAQ